MDSWFIGRGRDCDIVLDFPTVSRRHAKLTCSGQQIEIQDIGSSTGIFVMLGGEWSQVTQAAVSVDEPIRLGGYKTTARTLLAAVGIEIEAGPGSYDEEIKTVPRRGD
ncbi:MAG: FHA domain-containing protein [Alphaproteobacteria bacterium]|nr:FHA domain-containing protein [Alphaproteobacteria bacterium]